MDLFPNFVVQLKTWDSLKLKYSPKNKNDMASIAKVLGHPARIAILEHLLKSNACVCGDIVGELGLAQATVSQHLKELKKIGLIKGDVEGTKVCYCINTSRWKEFKTAFEFFFDKSLTTTNKC